MTRIAISEKDVKKTLVKTKSAKPGKMGRPAEKAFTNLSMVDFIKEHRLNFILEENPTISKIKLVQANYMNRSFSAANFEENRVEIARHVLEGRVEHQNIAFIKAVCMFIALHEFGEANGKAYRDLTKRYLKNINAKITTKKVEAPKTTVRVSRL